MEQLTFGEQVKIILGRKGMTIKELAEIIEERTGKKMSRQNLTQRLGRDNFQEQDMRMIADILGCSLQLSILAGSVERVEVPRTPVETVAAPTEKEWKKVELKRLQKAEERQRVLATEEAANKEVLKEVIVQEVVTEITTDAEIDMTIGELYEIHEELSELEEHAEKPMAKEHKEEEFMAAEAREAKKEKFRTGGIFLRKKNVNEKKEYQSEVQDIQSVTDTQPLETPLKAVPEPDSDDFEPVIKHDDVDENRDLGDINPYTRREFQTNSVRMHPSRIGYVQVYDRVTHKWTDMTEWAFLGYQERKKALLGKEYEPPIYLD